MAEHNKFGQQAEEYAKNYLIEQGYSILHTNWHYGHKEIDIIAQNCTTLIIVEVKARKSTDFGNPYEAVNNTKIHNIINATNAYINQYNINRETRFDIISVTQLDDNTLEIEHIIDAFTPPIS